MPVTVSRDSTQDLGSGAVSIAWPRVHRKLVLTPMFQREEILNMSLTKNAVMSPATLAMPIKSWLQVGELDAIVQLTTRKSIEELDTVGTVHFARWVNLHDHNQIAFFSVFDGSLRQYIEDFAKYMGPTFDLLFKHVVNAPPMPVQKNVDAFYDWIVANNLHVSGFYCAYPSLSVQDIRTAAGIVKGGVNTGKASPLTVVLTAKSPNHLAAASQSVTQAWPKFCEAADSIGTLHSARFVPLGTTTLAYVSEYNGTLENHVQDLSSRMGPLFDQILDNVVDSPPAPVQQNVPAFTKWISAHNIKPWWFFTAYPTLSVQDVRALEAKAA